MAWRAEPGRLELRVGDDGKGMPASAAPAGVIARAADLEGCVEWSPRAGGGTEAFVAVPVPALAPTERAT